MTPAASSTKTHGFGQRGSSGPRPNRGSEWRQSGTARWRARLKEARRYGGDITRAAKMLGYEPDTLYKAVWVAKTYEPWNRFQNLGFYHHQLLASDRFTPA